jgi:hypothetical protein
MFPLPQRAHLIATLPWAARRDASPYRVPNVYFARVWLIGRRKRERLRRIKRHVPTADKGRGKADANGSARGRLDAQDAAETAGAGAGRYSDQARHPVAADGLRRPRRTSRAGRERSAAENRRPQTCQPWRITRPPSRAALMQRRGSLSDRSRRQSCDCRGGGRNARRAYAQGIARLARYPPHDDRQHTHADRHRTQASAPHGKARRLGGTPRPTTCDPPEIGASANTALRQ